MRNKLVHKASPTVATLQYCAFYLLTISSIPVILIKLSDWNRLNYINRQFTDGLLRDWWFDVFKIFIKVEIELKAIDAFAEWFDSKVMKTLIIHSIVVRQLVEHSKEQIDWDQALHKIGLFALIVWLNSHLLVSLI